MSLQQRVTRSFEEHFGTRPPLVVRAPGRVNLIGEHTDYNDGFVLPMAIDHQVVVAARRREDARVVVHALDFEGQDDFGLHAIERCADNPWHNYVRGVAWSLQEEGQPLAGMDAVIAGDVPIGAGLSSSAAIEVAVGYAMLRLSGVDIDRSSLALAAQRAENDFVGMRCGIMDQMISAAGRAGHALLIDCRSLETRAVPLPPGTSVLVLDTMTRRGLVDSAYNERRSRCEESARFFGVPALRDVSMELFEAKGGGLDGVTRRRARHVITENARTLQAADAMSRGDAAEVGRLMDASHVSMRDDFEISNDELNVMVECAHREEGCYGARMTGGGFGGCAVALVRSELAQAIAGGVAVSYNRATGIRANIYICRATNGAEVVQGT